MDRRQLAAIILFFVTVWLVVFIAFDLWNSIKSVRESGKMVMFGNKTESYSKIQVSASTYPIYFFAQQIAGDKADVFQIVPADQENVKEYNLTVLDIDKISKSDLVIVNGFGLESWQNDAKNLALSNNAIFVVASDDIPQEKLIEEKSELKNFRIWLSLELAEKMADKILEGFLQADKQNQDYYKSNTEVLKKELAKINKEFLNSFALCEGNAVALFSGDFDYLLRDYNLTRISISNIYSNSLTQQQLESIDDFAESSNVSYIYFDKSFNQSVLDGAQKNISAEILILNQLDGLSSEDIKAGKNYFTEMRKNLGNIKEGLDCQ